MAGKHQKMYFSFFKIALFVLPIIFTVCGIVFNSHSAEYEFLRLIRFFVRDAWRRYFREGAGCRMPVDK